MTSISDKLTIKILAKAIIMSVALLSCAPSSAIDADSGLEDDAVSDVVSRLTGELLERYPLEDIGVDYHRAITKAWKQGRYRGLSACALAGRLSDDLQAVHADRHLRVWCAAETRASSPSKTIGHGFVSVTLDPDLSLAIIKSPGPWDLDDETFEAASHALNLAVDAENVVIDVRDNPGGHGEIGYFLASYFFPVGEARPFIRGFFHSPRRPEIASTLPFVPGHRLADAKLFIVVNERTGSAAEGFAFGMQQLGRATIVGQTTAGAGIAGNEVDLGSGITMFRPYKLIVSVNSDLTYEGKGVSPDQKTAPGEEYSRVASLIRDARDSEINRDAPTIIESVQPEQNSDLPPLNDTTSPFEYCQNKIFDSTNDALTMTNHCDRGASVQYMNGRHPKVLFEMHLKTGDAMKIHLPATGWWIMAVCPEGYLSTTAVNENNIDAIAAGKYSCSRQPPS